MLCFSEKILRIVRKQSKFNQLVEVTAFYLISDSNQQQFRCRKKQGMCQISKWQIFQEHHQFLRLSTELGMSFSDHFTTNHYHVRFDQNRSSKTIVQQRSLISEQQFKNRNAKIHLACSSWRRESQLCST